MSEFFDVSAGCVRSCISNWGGYCKQSLILFIMHITRDITYILNCESIEMYTKYCHKNKKNTKTINKSLTMLNRSDCSCVSVNSRRVIRPRLPKLSYPVAFAPKTYLSSSCQPVVTRKKSPFCFSTFNQVCTIFNNKTLRKFI